MRCSNRQEITAQVIAFTTNNSEPPSIYEIRNSRNVSELLDKITPWVARESGLAVDRVFYRPSESIYSYQRALIGDSRARLGRSLKWKEAPAVWALSCLSPGAYLPSAKTIVVHPWLHRFALSPYILGEIFRVTMAHELTHAAQDTAHEDWFAGIDRLISDGQRVGLEGNHAYQRAEGRMAWTEGHAVHVQVKFGKLCGQDLSEGTKWVNLAILIGCAPLCLTLTACSFVAYALSSDVRHKMRQYQAGLAAFNAIKEQGANMVQAMYQHPELVDILMLGWKDNNFVPDVDACLAAHRQLMEQAAKTEVA